MSSDRASAILNTDWETRGQHGRRAQAQEVGGSLSQSLRATGRFLVELLGDWQRAHQLARRYEATGRLDPHLLRDMGVNPQSALGVELARGESSVASGLTLGYSVERPAAPAAQVHDKAA